MATVTPGLLRLRSYERSWLRGDVLAGVTVAAYLIPQVMAYAEVAGLPPVVGLWAIMGPLFVYALIGSSRQLSVGPESTTALMTALVVAPLAGGDPARYAALAAALALIVGGLCLLAWLARLGFLADLFSHPVLAGYMAGIAVFMIVSQLTKITGVPVDGESLVSDVGSFLSGLDRMHLPTLVMSAAVLAFLLFGAWLWPKAPVPLVGMLLAAGVVAAFSLQDRGIRVVGEIPAGLPTPGLPGLALEELTALLLPAVGVTIVAYSDNVITARAFAIRNGYHVDANQELLALGTANLSAGVLRGFPVSSSASRTVIADALGNKSQLYSLIALGAVLATLLVGRTVLAAFPSAALGAIVVYAALRLIEVSEFRRIGAFRRSELVLALATTAAVLLLGVLYGVLAAVGLSILNLLRRVARPHDGVLGYVPGLAGMHDIDDYPDATLVPGLVVYRYDAPLCFANAENFRQRALAAVDASPTPVEWFMLNAEANVEVDITAIDTVEELRAELDRRGIVFAMARVKQDMRADLAAAGLVERVGDDRIFPTLPTAVQAYVEWYTARHGEPPVGGVAPPAAARHSQAEPQS
ncbi:MAG TPA: sulfate permease [Jiangellaceae bacterium]|nr:sulfate permease [Jiangellaceae bacterium]